MNTKFVMPRLENAIGSKAKASFAAIKTYSGELHSVELGLVTAGLFASAYVVETKALLAAFNVYP
jgi:hypothetical protein